MANPRHGFKITPQTVILGKPPKEEKVEKISTTAVNLLDFFAGLDSAKVEGLPVFAAYSYSDAAQGSGHAVVPDFESMRFRYHDSWQGDRGRGIPGGNTKEDWSAIPNPCVILLRQTRPAMGGDAQQTLHFVAGKKVFSAGFDFTMVPEEWDEVEWDEAESDFRRLWAMFAPRAQEVAA